MFDYDEMIRHREFFLSKFPGNLTFQTFDDTTQKRKHLARIFHGWDEKTHMALDDLNDQGAGVFLTINETNKNGRTANDIINVRAVFADFDGVSPLGCMDDMPHVFIESSRGKFHAYWLTSDVPRAGFRQLQESIAHKYGSDPKVKDLPRVMRVPGFFHCKGEPFMTKILSYSKRDPMSFRELSEMFPPPPREKWITRKSVKVFKHDSDGEFRGQYGAGEGERNNSLCRAIGGMIKRGLPWHKIEDEAFKHGYACSPPLSAAEIKNTLRSTRRYL